MRNHEPSIDCEIVSNTQNILTKLYVSIQLKKTSQQAFMKTHNTAKIVF